MSKFEIAISKENNFWYIRDLIRQDADLYELFNNGFELKTLRANYIFDIRYNRSLIGFCSLIREGENTMSCMLVSYINSGI